MSPESAEMTKYVANALLSTKISFINEMANLCERMGADINDVRRGIGHDSRIGFAFLFPGVGYGGSCFPKDVRALAVDGPRSRRRAAHPRRRRRGQHAAEDDLCREDRAALRRQAGRASTIAVWGLAFKPRHRRHPRGAGAGADRPAAGRGRTVPRPRSRGDGQRAASLRRPAVLLPNSPTTRWTAPTRWRSCTEWKQFVHPDFEEMRRLMKTPVIFDGRNLYEPAQMKAAGFTYYCIGRTKVSGG